MCIETSIETSAKLRRNGMKMNGINANIVLGTGGAMSPRWGWEYYFGMGFYKHVAPLGLGIFPPSVWRNHEEFGETGGGDSEGKEGIGGDVEMNGLHNAERCRNHNSVRSAMCGHAPDMSPR